MFHSFLLQALVTAGFLHSVTNAQLTLKGALNYVESDVSGLVLVTIENNTPRDYFVAAENNLFDNDHPYQPLQVRRQNNSLVNLIGAQYSYSQQDDSSYLNISSGVIWQREFNLTQYMPPISTAPNQQPDSECFNVSIPAVGWLASDTTDLQYGTNLATWMLQHPLQQLTINALPLHVNITVQPPTAAALTQGVPAQPLATEILGTQVLSASDPRTTFGTSIDPYLGGLDSSLS